MFYKDNWLSWTYDDGPLYGPKLTPQSTFKITLSNAITRPIKSYYEELLENARIIRDTFSGDLDLLLSGGVDSEVILRTYCDLKIPINVYIFKYENGYNLQEYNRAISTCSELNVKPRIINFNLEKFFENEAYDIWTKVYSATSGWLPHLKMTEYCDGVPIIGSGESYIRRTSRDLSKKFPWVFELDEKCHHWAVYHKTINRPAITDWYEYSPELTASYFTLPFVQDLLNDKVPGKLSNESTKAFVHQTYWPTLQDRTKLIGFEGAEQQFKNPGVPPFMLEFGYQYGGTRGEKVKLTAQTYTEQELLRLIGA